MMTPHQASVIAAGFRDFFERPAGQAVFEQIGAALQGRLEGMGLRVTVAPSGSRHVPYSVRDANSTLMETK
jgi:hypothetical protein